jgi:pyruvate formate lyase activating enzyme
MKVAALLKFSTIDLPGKLSAVIFCQGCYLRCIYCHNPEFLNLSDKGKLEFSDVLKFLKTRDGLLDGVVFSGGDPMILEDICDRIEDIKSLGFLVGIHTSGYCPNNFEDVLKIVDWIGYDIKTSFDKYEKITKVSNSGNVSKLNFEKLLKSGVDYEVRTTLDTRCIAIEDMIEVAKYLKDNGVKEWILQECIIRDANKKIESKIPMNKDEILSVISKYITVKFRRQ